MFAVQNQASRRTIQVKLSGVMSEDEMARFAEEYRRVTDSYQGEAHLVLADMRGLKTCSPPVAMILLETIAYARKRGVVACAHLSDDTVTRLQMLRLGRKVADYEDVTIDVISIEEAEHVLSEKRFEILFKGGPASSRSGPSSESFTPSSAGSGPISEGFLPPSSGSSPVSSGRAPISSREVPIGAVQEPTSAPMSPRRRRVASRP